MSRNMDDSDLALETAIGNLASGDDCSSGSDRETEETPAPVRVVVRPDAEGSLLSGSGGTTSFQQCAERAMEDDGGSGGTGSGGGGGEDRRPSHPLHYPRSQVTLDVIIADSKLFTMFRLFLKDQCITRNLNFWLACSYYHQLPGGTAEYQEQLYKVAKAIYVKYIKVSAPQLVQVKPSTKRTIKSILSLDPKTLSPSLFKPAQDEVWELMERNEMRQFLASDVFGELFSDVDDSLSMDLTFTPVGPVLRGGSPLHHSSSEDTVSVASSNDGGGGGGGGSELGRLRNSRLRPPFHRSNHRSCSSDTEAKTHHSYAAGPLAKKDKPVTREDFVAMVSERLMAVQKDRDHMRKRAQEQARQQGRSFEEIIAIDWYDLPHTAKYIDLPQQHMETLREVHSEKQDFASHRGIPPSHSPYPQSSNIDAIAQREIQDALKDLEITTQVNRNRRHMMHLKSSSMASSILSYTSDSGVGDSVPWGTTASSCSVVGASQHVQRYIEGQNKLLNQTTQREIDAKAAAITLINNSPHPEDLSHRVSHTSLSSRHRLPPQHPLSRSNYTGAYSSDDNSSFLTITSESDLFIPRRYPPPNYSESDEPHHFTRAHHRQLSKPRSTRFNKVNHAPPIVEPSHTPSSQTPRLSTPAASQKSSTGSGILVLYDLVDISTPPVKRPPFAKKHPSSNVTLAEFKERIFSRKGDYRFFFKSFCEDIDDAIMEEISDEETVLPHYEGKIIARVETVA